ncbi:MAG: PIN domain nuclease [Acidobacteriaceae bacterium]|nr:PIN domain nuclease [Acidobacteriaceae bacterium]
MTLVDTSVWIDYLRNRSTPATQWLDSNLERQRIGLTDLVFREVLQGERTLDGMSTLAEAFNGFEVLTTGGRELSLASAKNYITLRNRGITVRSTIDCLLATHCIREGHRLLHNDRDFDAFEKHLGLAVVRP